MNTNTTPLIEHIHSTQTHESAGGRPFIVDWHWGEDEDGFYLLGCSFEPLSVDGEAMPQMHLMLSEDDASDADGDWVVSECGKGYVLYFCGVAMATHVASFMLSSPVVLHPPSDFRPGDDPTEAYIADLRSAEEVAR